MTLEELIVVAKHQGASDLHLEPGMPPTLRVRGSLAIQGTQMTAPELRAMALDLLGPDNWEVFQAQQSFDMSATVSGIRCRFNILKSARGIGFAIRLLMPFKATIDTLNLHPDLRTIIDQAHGLVVVSGATGCGKSSTIAALVQEINLSRCRHIITIESPIEHNLRSNQSLIRQREVGRDTPSFDRALLDTLREDPDVIVVGEMRDPETMRLTINAAETGHLVFATVHSSSIVDALQRIVSAFPAEAQNSVCAQLATCLSAVISQRLVYRPDLKIRVPECEILFSNDAVRGLIFSSKLNKLTDVVMTSAADKMWSLQRYRAWLNARTSWYIDDAAEAEGDVEDDKPEASHTPQPARPRPERRAPQAPGRPAKPPPTISERRLPVPEAEEQTIIEIGDDDDLEALVKDLDRPKK